MHGMLKRALDSGLALNGRATEIANNAFDRMFRPGTLIKSDQTPYEVIHAADPMSVRYYPPLREDEVPLVDGSSLPVAKTLHEVPLIIVPPLAASPLIFDLLPERSMVRYLAARGFRVYLIDWGAPGRRHSHLGIKEFAEDMMTDAVAQVRAHSGVEPVSLLGWCMGGLFSLIYAGLSHDTEIRNIITIASPIDSRQGGAGGMVANALTGPANLIRKYTNFRLHKVDPKYLQVPGWFNSIAFKLTNPVGSLTTYWDLVTRLWDREYVEAHTTTSNFLDKMFNYPGGIIQDFVVKMGVDNDFSRGRIEIGDKVSALDRVECSLLVFAGEADAIVTPRAAHRVIELVSSGDKEFVVAPGGHAGVVMGAKAQKLVWTLAADWLQTRSSLRRRAAA